jgi:hypothetical protein
MHEIVEEKSGEEITALDPHGNFVHGECSASVARRIAGLILNVHEKVKLWNEPSIHSYGGSMPLLLSPIALIRLQTLAEVTVTTLHSTDKAYGVFDGLAQYSQPLSNNHFSPSICVSSKEDVDEF